ncbi:Multihaem cytochrome [Acididesulfobacillus acetoxydans]|uniref:CheY-like superfamily n=1 Tax=Acididesulfobacillus acetoxydans TaxID=1561005 RepID=A0A8S0WM70_9FIRM|nr:hypothetical protein [Acididesulfobacillus acetoxydans]CAA7600424.1 Multihaem cytochrome [Acididesulfobacillus acetoxydans]CEJ06558.1 CheY-like superfamily [Acididesulfobacillus acetoxydans]
MNEKRWILFTTAFSVVLVSGLLLSAPKMAEAACGASTSSCKTCHEVQGKLPVNQKGAWHTQHAFGDFCQACHLGNASETDMTKAHVGVIKNPLTEPSQTCASCHPSNTAAMVAKYGGSAGSSGPTGSTPASGGTSAPAAGSSSTPASGSASSPSPAATQVPAVSQPGAAQTSPSANPNFDVIDFNKNFQSPVSLWTIVFGLVDLVILLALAVLLWRWWKGVWLWQYLKPRNAGEHLVNLKRESPEIRDIFYKLRDCEPETVTAVAALLNRGREGQKLLRTVAGLSPELLDKLQGLPETDLDLIVRLSKAVRSKEGR